MNSVIIKKILIVFAGIFLFRLGSHIPVPGINIDNLNLMFNQYKGTLVDMFNVFSGGSLKRFSIFSIGIVPFITSSIIIQMLSFFHPVLKELKSDPKGQIKISLYTRYLTIVLATFQAFALTSTIATQGMDGFPIANTINLNFYITSMVSLVAGTMLLVWISEKITEYGIGNGLSIIIFSGIISNLPSAVSTTMELFNSGELSILSLVVLLIIMVIAVFFVIFMEKSQKKIPLDFSRRGKDSFHANKGHLPLKVNMAGVMPPILASTLLVLPLTLKSILENMGLDISNILNFVQHGSISYIMLFCLLIVGFSFFYVALQYNISDMTKNLKESGTFINGLRPGEKTKEYLKHIFFYLSIIGAGYLIIICLIPEIISYNWNVSFYFGGTSLLIMVMVSLELNNQIHSHRIKKDYNKIEKELKAEFNNK